MQQALSNPLVIFAISLVTAYLLKVATTKRVRFTATKTVREPVNVSFKTKNGDHVSFGAHRKRKKRVPVDFRARR
ncbi:MAG TPA: hypothetical protein VHE09_00320 [Rhizomicrobium sp.]|jgi:hypothetical protein|nr:hypothetical protein [Rhizomicrobium sp.]